MKKPLLIFIIILIAFVALFNLTKSSNLPIVAIANYGPHSSLDNTIKGIKDELAAQGYIAGKTINYEILDVGFDSSLIPQMITKLKAQNPAVMIVMTTPVAQFAKNAVKNIPLVFADITDPVSAGLLKNESSPDGNMTGASERQDLELLLDFAKIMLPKANRVGVLYSTAETNDKALVQMLKTAANLKNMQVVTVSIDQPRDVHVRMQSFKDKVDFIYVGTSGPIQPTLPVIVAQADKMNIPIFNADSDAVKHNQVLASFGVNYEQVGINAGKLVTQILKNGDILPPIYPSRNDHYGFVSKKRAKISNAIIPSNVTIVE